MLVEEDISTIRKNIRKNKIDTPKVDLLIR